MIPAHIVLLLCLVSAALSFDTPRAGVRFVAHPVATGLTGGYQVVSADLNRDGRPDLIALASGLGELAWFENPGWQRHVIAKGLSQPINIAAWDWDEDGYPEIALAQEFSPDPRRSSGSIFVLKRRGDPRELWSMTEIDRLPTSHRLRWADIDGNGRKVLVNAPLAGAKCVPPDYADHTPLVYYRPGSWKRELISDETRGIQHGIHVVDWDRDGRDEILAASFEGIHLLRRTSGSGSWVRTELAKGNPEPWPRSGSSDVAVGRLGAERFLCAIEPWHGNQLAVYRPRGQAWRRYVIDSTFTDGHALAVADLDGDGRDEILGGYRGGDHSVFLYSADSKGPGWSRRPLDQGGMAAASCAVTDINGDGRPDIACIGTATANLKWYENLWFHSEIL